MTRLRRKTSARSGIRPSQPMAVPAPGTVCTLELVDSRRIEGATYEGADWLTGLAVWKGQDGAHYAAGYDVKTWTSDVAEIGKAMPSNPA